MITNGQQRAISELARLSAIDQNSFQFVNSTHLDNGWLVATISVHIGAIEVREGGLDLRDREEFFLWVPPEFPFDRPRLSVAHTRFAGFPHVTWSTSLCLYQSDIEWNPSDGLYGFFDRLKDWLGKAAINEMDPIDGPLEPPHHDTDFSQAPFVIRANAPCKAGEEWIGVAVLEKHVNRTELIAWNDLSSEWPVEGHLAFAIVLPNALPMEFPSNGADLFRELEKAGIDRDRAVRSLALAALFSPEGEPVHLVLGLPMRRANDGTQRLHIAVWTTDVEIAGSLRHVLPEGSDTEAIRNLRKELSNLLTSVFELSKIKWCQVLEDRHEIVVRRDNGTSIAWFTGKKVLVLGCGALGSWIAEIIARANPSQIHLVDNSVVKPGILARQNFELQDIGANKANALARRLSAITHNTAVIPHPREAHAFIIEAREHIQDYDVVLDCTASVIFQMKLERDWAGFARHTPPFISLIIDARASHCLCVVASKDSVGGIWDGYLWLKWRLCTEGIRTTLITAFYSSRVAEKLFQPEPGCSDPTFAGSTADVVSLASSILNVAIDNVQVESSDIGLALSVPTVAERVGVLDAVKPPQFCDTQVGSYRIRISMEIFPQARAWIQKNRRHWSPYRETGGLLWGVWDDAIQGVWIFDLSGPPPDSRHAPGRFVCGTKGTLEEHNQRMEKTHGVCGFVGHWHTHPNLPSRQSDVDIDNMTRLVSSIGQNQKRSLMLIFGRTGEIPTVGLYVYESQSYTGSSELISIDSAQITLDGGVM